MPFFLLFIMIPLAELIVFMLVSDIIGLGMALFIALFTAILGGSIVRYQGLQTIMNAQSSLHRGALPSRELFDGLCLVAAGATLITPGFITDAIGFMLLVPALRDALRKALADSKWFKMSGFTSEQSSGDDNAGIIDAEYETLEEK